MFNEQKEISAETIDMYMKYVNNLSISTGKLDMLLSYCEQKTQEQPLNIKKVVSNVKENKQALKPIVKTEDKSNSYYVFKNSTNLVEIINTNKIKTRIKFQNGRLYDFFNIPQRKIETLITCDKNMISPGRYFNSEIRGQYEYREVTKDLEMVG